MTAHSVPTCAVALVLFFSACERGEPDSVVLCARDDVALATVHGVVLHERDVQMTRAEIALAGGSATRAEALREAIWQQALVQTAGYSDPAGPGLARRRAVRAHRADRLRGRAGVLPIGTGLPEGAVLTRCGREFVAGA